MKKTAKDNLFEAGDWLERIINGMWEYYYDVRVQEGEGSEKAKALDDLIWMLDGIKAAIEMALSDVV